MRMTYFQQVRYWCTFRCDGAIWMKISDRTAQNVLGGPHVHFSDWTQVLVA